MDPLRTPRRAIGEVRKKTNTDENERDQDLRKILALDRPTPRGDSDVESNQEVNESPF
jgi:Sec-independent protein translocase protein TatA